MGGRAGGVGPQFKISRKVPEKSEILVLEVESSIQHEKFDTYDLTIMTLFL